MKISLLPMVLLSSIPSVAAKIRGDATNRKKLTHQLRIPIATKAENAGDGNGRRSVVRAKESGMEGGGFEKVHRRSGRKGALPPKTPQALGRASSSR
mmetsp:Transcript_7106/g.17332  ORF Transcript_7106/g.17332 Transcript_7106/m.17332 type:complete len:97 (+) Transcript_7106:350-640(+)